MGLGKTVQGVGTAELLAKYAGISRVLVICPASLKTQWSMEIKRFSDRTCQLVLGSAKERADQYDSASFFTICNYEQVLRDILAIEKAGWDLIILDEGQRIKNWEAKTSRIIKSLKSPFALVLSGTPLENRLDELFSVVEFIDDRRLGPAFRFYNRHRIADEKGRVLGYKNLDELRERLKPVLIRRTRKKVMKELPPRTTEIRRIPPTDEQLEMHEGQRRTISTLLNKKYFTEMDFLRLQKALLICRMSANSTFLVDKRPPGYSSKLNELEALLDQLLEEEGRKIILFSEWTTMLNLIEPILDKRKVSYVRLDGSVPQKKRQALVHQFQQDPVCKLFVTTNAGSTGLNLQAANTVVNVDLPWNPAILEQRISRAHRMGQKRPVHVFLLVTEATLEESLLTTLSAKHELALAALDPDAEATEVDLTSGVEELKRRLEILLGTKPEAPEDQSLKEQVQKETEELVARKERIASAGGQLVGAALSFLGEMLSGKEDTEKSLQFEEMLKERLSECMERGEDGSLRMTIALPDESALDTMSKSLAKMIAG
jgi:SNF2 family DNA or RNA helicase